MTAESDCLRELFLAALKLPATARDAFLREVCGGADDLRERVALLIQAHEELGTIAPSPEADAGQTRDLPATTVRPGDWVAGQYKLLALIGEGGMGEVWLAEQTEPVRRQVAVKLIQPGMDSKQILARFEAERQALALMDHPNIAKVLDAGATETGRPYFVMEVIKGVPITKHCDEQKLSPRERLELFVPVCHAVQHAHQKGIIHRDLKPSNVLVGLYDGRPVVKVIDFGVAKATGQRLTEKTLFTGLGAVVGTLEYMSPEQASLDNLDADTRSDIYSLGVMLYELLTGSTPLDRKRLKESAYAEILRMIREEEPPKPSTRLRDSGETLASVSAQRHMEPAKLTKLVRGELDWIVMKCLEKDRNRRYETVSALAADVQRYLRDEPVQACPPSAWYTFRKFARRKKALLITASAIALALLMAVATLAVSGVLVWQTKQDLQHTLYFHRVALAHRELGVDNLHGALKLLEECPKDLREWEWHYLMRLCLIEPLVLQDKDKKELNGVAFSPDGEHLASAGGDGAVRIWNSRTGNVIQTIEKAHTDSVVSVAFHPDGKHVASAGADRIVKVWDLTTEQEVFSGPCDAIRKHGTAYTVAFRPPDGRQLAAGSDGVVSVWDWQTKRLLHTFPGHELHSISVAFSRDGRRLATGTFQEGVRVWDAERGGLLQTIPAHRHPLSALAFSADGGRLASASFDHSVKLWDTTTGGLLHTFLHSGNVECVAFSPDGRRLASGGEDKTVRVWDATSGREVLGLRGHTGNCRCVTFSPDGRRLASASADGTIRIWDGTPLQGNERGQEILTFNEHGDEIRSVAFSPDGQWIASAEVGGLVKVWDAQTGRVSVEFGSHTVTVFSVAWQPGGHRIASAGAEVRLHSVKVWDARTGHEAFSIPAGRESFQAVAFSPDGCNLVTGQVNGAVQVWDAGDGQNVATLGTHHREIRGVVFSHKGGHLATASGDGEVKLWDATRLDQKQEARHTLRARVPGASLNVAFSPDGQRLATGGEEFTVKIWDVQNGQELKTLRGHKGDVYTVAFSPDGHWLASAGEDSVVKIWDSDTGKLIHNFRGHRGLVSSLAFSPDGRLLVTGSRDKTVKVWDVAQLKEESDR